MTHVLTPTYIDKQQMRLELALPAAPLWDSIGDTATPLPLFVGGAKSMTITFVYWGNKFAAGAAFDFRLFVSPENPVTNWFQTPLYDAGALAAGVDVGSAVQREYITYTATGLAAPELFVYGKIDLGGGVEWIFISSRESGDPNNPGTLRVDIDLEWEKERP